MDLWLMVYEGAFFPAGMGWDTYDGIGIGRYAIVRWDGSGYTLYYYYSSLEPPSSRLFLKLYMYYVLCTCLNESFIIKKNKD